MIGVESKQVIAVGVKSSTCKLCERHTNKGKTPPPHTCNQNWTGSAKSMESGIVCDMLQDVADKGVDVTKIYADGDTTTMSLVREKINHVVEKGEDGNHVRKNFTAGLMKIRDRHKAMTQKVMDSIKKNFAYALHQNQGNPEGLKKALIACKLHPFGDHSQCGEWCRGVKDKAYKHNNLPYGKDLKDADLKADLSSFFDNYIAKAKELSDLGSTQNNESFNNMVGVKVPKRVHYAGGPTLKYRVNQAVLQKNRGYAYLSKVLKLGYLTLEVIFIGYVYAYAAFLLQLFVLLPWNYDQ